MAATAAWQSHARARPCSTAAAVRVQPRPHAGVQGRRRPLVSATLRMRPTTRDETPFGGRHIASYLLQVAPASIRVNGFVLTQLAIGARALYEETRADHHHNQDHNAYQRPNRRMHAPTAGWD